MFPEACSPGNAVFTKKGDWGTAANGAWHNYSKTIFGKEECSVRYIPLHVFPFFQQKNFMIDGKPPNALPMSLLNKLQIRITFTDNFDHIFRKLAGNTKMYSLKFSDVKLVYEEARLSPAFERSFLNTKRLLPFSGVTKFAVSENVPAGTFSHRLRFQDIYMPEGVFIFALPKEVVGGQFKYSTSTSDQVFSNHNIEKVDLAFGGLPFQLKAPRIGDIEDDIIEIKMLIDHLEYPPFGMLQDPKHLTYETIQKGCANTPYPHVYINLTTTGNETRLVPLSDNGAIINRQSDLDIVLNFGTGGATTGVNYFIYIFYTDVNIVLDMKNLRFKPQYNRLRPPS
jgi:hypothetical protein